MAYQASQIFGRPLVKRLTLCYRTVVCPAGCVSVTLVYCGQTVGLIKMKLGIEVGLGPGHIVLDGRPSSPTERGTAVHHFSAAPYCGGGVISHAPFSCRMIVSEMLALVGLLGSCFYANRIVDPFCEPKQQTPYGTSRRYHQSLLVTIVLETLFDV